MLKIQTFLCDVMEINLHVLRDFMWPRTSFTLQQRIIQTNFQRAEKTLVVANTAQPEKLQSEPKEILRVYPSTNSFGFLQALFKLFNLNTLDFCNENLS